MKSGWIRKLTRLLGFDSQDAAAQEGLRKHQKANLEISLAAHPGHFESGKRLPATIDPECATAIDRLHCHDAKGTLTLLARSEGLTKAQREDARRLCTLGLVEKIGGPLRRGRWGQGFRITKKGIDARIAMAVEHA